MTILLYGDKLLVIGSDINRRNRKDMTTTITVQEKTLERIKNKKIHRREPSDEVINRLLDNDEDKGEK